MLKKGSGKANHSSNASAKEAISSESKQNAALEERGRYEALRCGASGENVNDFLSEYFLGCLLSPDPSNPALTCTCGTNRARTYLRREWRWKQRITLAQPAEIQALIEAGKNPELSPTRFSTPARHSLRQDLQSHLSSALSELTAPQQNVLYLRLIEGLSFGEIAAQTGQTSVAARMMIRSAQRRLGNLLASSDLPCGEACEYLSLLEREDA